MVVAKETGRRALVHQGTFVKVVGNGETLISGVLCPSSGSGSFLAVAAAVADIAVTAGISLAKEDRSSALAAKGGWPAILG